MEDGHNTYVFLLGILLVNGEKRALASIYMGSLYARLGECVANVVLSLRRYDVVSHVFFQMFLWEHFEALAPACWILRYA